LEKNKINVGSASNTLQICLLRLIYFRNSAIEKLFTTRYHCAAATRALVFQMTKWFTATITLTTETYY